MLLQPLPADHTVCEYSTDMQPAGQRGQRPVHNNRRPGKSSTWPLYPDPMPEVYADVQQQEAQRVLALFQEHPDSWQKVPPILEQSQHVNTKVCLQWSTYQLGR